MAGGKQSRLSDEHIQRIVEMTLEIQKQKEAEEQKARYDRRFMNTKLLLKNFRAFADMEDSSIYEASQCSDDAYEILSTMFDQPSMDELRVESIKRVPEGRKSSWNISEPRWIVTRNTVSGPAEQRTSAGIVPSAAFSSTKMSGPLRTSQQMNTSIFALSTMI